MSNKWNHSQALNLLTFYHMVFQVNQIGSVTESIEAVKMSKHAGWGVMASHRRYRLLLLGYFLLVSQK